MANRRELKKVIKSVTAELVSEMYILSFFREVDEKKLDELVGKTLDMNELFVQRISHVDGKEDAKLVKAYFRNLRNEWAGKVAEIADEVGKL